MSLFDTITGMIKNAKAKRATRRQTQNAARKANKWNLKPFAPTLSLRELDDVARLTNHVHGLVAGIARNAEPGDAEDIASGYDWSPIDVAQTEINLTEALDAQFPADDQPPANGYDYQRDVQFLGENAIKPKGSNAWPWNKALACCGLSEKQCQCGKWRRYF